MATRLIQGNQNANVYISNGVHKMGPLTAAEQIAFALAGMLDQGGVAIMEQTLVNKIRTV
jgi:hypothetical protein